MVESGLRSAATDEPLLSYTPLGTGQGSADTASARRQRVQRRCIVGAVGTLLVCAGALVPRGPALIASPLPRVSEMRTATSGASRTCARVVQTAHGSKERLAMRGCEPFVADFEATTVIDVTGATPQHEILGFGGAFTESSALVYQALPPDMRKRFINAYFALGDDEGKGEEGIGYTLGRVHINSCDFSVNSYSFDDVPEDFELQYFDDELGHDARTMIPLIHDAQRAAPLKLRMLASPWSPPAWMKKTRKMDGSDPAPGLRDECRDVWARYVSRWVTAYEQLGIPIWAVTMQNEPENRAAWEACAYDPEQGAAFVRDYLGPTLRADHPDLKIFAFDHNKVRTARAPSLAPRFGPAASARAPRDHGLHTAPWGACACTDALAPAVPPAPLSASSPLCTHYPAPLRPPGPRAGLGERILLGPAHLVLL
jgi:glucosylceramidase